MKTPSTYLPEVSDLIWLISESPRGNSVWNLAYEGRATARELAKIIWQGTDPDAKIFFKEEYISPTTYIKILLNEKIRSRTIPNLKRAGEEYCALDTVRIDRGSVFDRAGNFTEGKSLPRPEGLPFWEGVN